MAITDLIKGLLGGSSPAKSQPTPEVSIDAAGVMIQGKDLPEKSMALNALEETAREHNQLLRYEAKGELHLSAKECASLPHESARALGLPEAFKGQFKVAFTGRTTEPGFSGKISLLLDGEEVYAFQRQGAVLVLGAKERYRLTTPQLKLFELMEGQSKNSNESVNVALLLALKKLQRRGLSIDLGVFEKFAVDEVKKPTVTVREAEDGSLQLSPNLTVRSRDGDTPLAATDVAERMGQIDQMTGDQGVLRVKDRFLVLGKKCLAGIRDIVSQPVIPAAEKQAFIDSPGMFLDNRNVDLESGFSYQMKGVETFCHIPFGASEKSLLPWFGTEPLPCLDVEAVEDLFSTLGEAQVLRSMAESARDSGCKEVFFKGKRIGIGDWPQFEQQIEGIMTKLALAAGSIDPSDDEDSEFGQSEDTIVLSPAFHQVKKNSEKLRSDVEQAAPYSFEVYDNLKKTPFPHQKEAVEWLMTLYGLATSPVPKPEPVPEPVSKKGHSAARIQGALLGDDMGLGKSFITLSFLNEISRRQQQLMADQSSADDLAPVLLVAPLSLLKNWQDEMIEAYHEPIFTDTVVLQSDEDLRRFLVTKPQVETKVSKSDLEGGAVSMSAVRYGLKVGEGFEDEERLDTPRRLVLTTYQVLRDYPFSLAKVKWSAVIFDEGQAIKNPNSMQTRGAKALTADFKLMLTGTPVENSFADIWCLMDISQPGILGEWQGFKEQFISPILGADNDQQLAVKERLGQQLREIIGPFMLRRLKRDVLKDLPAKNIHKGVSITAGADSQGPHQGVQPEVSIVDASLARQMPDEQVAAYDAAIGSYQRKGASSDKDAHEPLSVDRELSQEAGEDSDSDTNATSAIVSLMHLKNISLHPAMALPDSPSFADRAEAERFMARSAKTQITLDTLNSIAAKGEKAIVFVIARKMQWLMKAALEAIYDQDVAIINGDTKAVIKPSARTGGEPELTRKQLIDKFQEREGFGVIIISPIAAGTGLTITKANHVIHLERHWNPAKEAQATDRVYRIGQDKPVHIYYPFALHPEKASFDVNLDLLLSRKEDLGESVRSGAGEDVMKEMVARELESNSSA